VATAIDQAAIAKLIAAQVANQFQAHFATSTPHNMPLAAPTFPPPAEDPCMTAEEW
jgi:hypothetical protein